MTRNQMSSWTINNGNFSIVVMTMAMAIGSVVAFTAMKCGDTASTRRRVSTIRLMAEWNDSSENSNMWISQSYEDEEGDWREVMKDRQDGSYWESADDSGGGDKKKNLNQEENTSEDESEAWLDTLATLQGEEVKFIMKEADRADKARRMEELGFDPDVIANTLDVAIDDKLETIDEVARGAQNYRESQYLDDDSNTDWTTVESHTTAEKDSETGKIIEKNMVYVDEFSCIGCTNCASIAQSTFLMDEEHGRARAFKQGGDDDVTIQIAIDTCPVNCIHYIAYDELVRLEVRRRDQSINPKSQLVSRGETGGSGAGNYRIAATAVAGNDGSKTVFTSPPKIIDMDNLEINRRINKDKIRIVCTRLQKSREAEGKIVEL